MKYTILSLFMYVALTLAESEERNALTLRNGNNQFTSKMFSEIVREKPNESVVLSAYSVLTPLAQLALASEGESHDELLAAIGMPNDNVTKEIFSSLDSNLKAVKGVTLKSASKIYVAKNYELNEQFAEVSRDVFHSEVQNLDFVDNQRAANEVNAWVEGQTNNRIKNLVSPDSLDENTRAILVNAIYFKGLWKYPFSNYTTAERDFHVTKEKTVKVEMMHQVKDLRYAESPELNAKLLELPYEGDQASMLLVLPNEVDGISQLEDKLKDPNALENAIAKLETVEVSVSLPKFKIETETNLRDVLTNINVKRLFTSEARLNNLLKGTSNIYIDKAVQKAFIEVNEEGAEASAANEFEVVLEIISVNFNFKIPIFEVNRPFFFDIRADGAPLFSGVNYN
ncbi:alaserpin-like isoform X4 [Leptidea sinapis]|uniref:alaserpin-like isoform X4 n=1 Tax=Leptidea sinapis TaxID=189913 RepID=UPI0021C3B0B9|nr:alaserpin-like isoform X4 [Leptidea sinapis]